MATEPSPFIWYDLMTPDLKQAEAFYRAVVGWEIADSGMPGMTYLMLKARGVDVGGMMTLPADSGLPSMWGGYIHSRDVDADCRRAVSLGGRVCKEPEDIPDVGRFAVLADPGGVVFRSGLAEAAVDLVRAAGLEPIATFCQVLGDDGELLRGDALDAFAAHHSLPEVKVAELFTHRMASETFVRQLSQATLPTRHGSFLTRAFENRLDHRQHLVLSLGETRTSEPVLVRLHSECLTGDVFHSLRCDCGPQLDQALARVAEAGRGVVLYLRQEGRGIGLLDKIRAYALQDEGRDTVQANLELGLPVDNRDYGLAAQILHTLGVRRVRLLTNNPDKIQTLAQFGVEVVAREPLLVPPSDDNRDYLLTKKTKLGHLLGDL